MSTKKKESQRAADRRYYKRHTAKRKASSKSGIEWRMMKYRYGITRDQYEAMLVGQGFRCAICGSQETGNKTAKRLSVDHNHHTGEVRGLLCVHCNRGLGAFKDDPIVLQQAITYLRDRAI